MLVDPVSTNNTPHTPANMNDLEEYINTELFGPSSSVAAMSPGPSGSSRASSPSSHSDSLSQILSTPPQTVENTFPDPYSFLNGLSGVDSSQSFGFGYNGGNAAPSFFNFLDEEMKADPSPNAMSFEPSPSFDFMSALGLGGVSGLTIDSSTSSSSPSTSAPGSVAMAIDPQLVGSPSTNSKSDFGDAEDQDEHSGALITDDEQKPQSPSTLSSEDAVEVIKEKLTVTITPVKVGGHGKARKGTVQSGGVTKKTSTPAPSTVLPVPLPVFAAPSPSSSATSASYLTSASAASLLSRNKENVSAASPSPSTASNTKASQDKDKDKDDDDDLPADWRPPPEVFAKMSSKEKRQLRNKISARNFRVRRKEYISTLEMDIAERDRLLQAIRSELGSTQSENLALRQEVAALKKALLEGRGAGMSPISPSSSSMIRSASPALSIRGADVNLNSAAVTTGLTIDDLNLPPPAPLPERSAAEELALRATAAAGVSPASSSTLLVPNTHKDLPTSPRLNNTAGFWGGVSQAGFGFGGMGSGYTPVHTVLMPDLNTNLNVGGTNMSIGQWVRDVLAANAANSRDGSSSPEGSPRPLQENINPVMNVPGAHQDEHTSGSSAGPHSGFEGFVDTNPFTMKTLDAYRMQLWTKMAASSSQAPHSNHSSPPVPSPQSSHSNNHSSAYAQQRKALEREMAAASPFTLPSHQPGSKHSHHFNSLATNLKPAYFVNSNKPNLPSTPPPKMGSTLSALLAGKHATPSALGSSLASSSVHPSTHSYSNTGRTSPTKQQQQQQMQQAQTAVYAALASTASQTLMRRLGNAFWDAFSGSSAPSSSQHGAHSHMKPWDADKVRKVLEGKAVIKVVDVDEPVQHVIKREPMTPMHLPSTSESDKCCSTTALLLLEESMRSLTVSKK
ncbi:hypothetical protein EV361DRAFT_871172 [Lentinula raphanica]|uniref:BZIP domain-containing protein n=1 Tax=Lentinula raphanica TaxID=153919 RepID=A0AA38UJK9_9AGAR|nr:hypothetical protein F5878DRAFT_656054 [Lentinula raphanica]KAJ3968015.1 hypothetical protein EV361DRAFT_871172 [Lentinula raphanica]